jgi:hypothetical protein
MATGWIVITILWKLPDPYWILTYLAVFCLVPVQAVVNDTNRATNPSHDGNSAFTGWNIATVVVGSLLFVLAMIGAFTPGE